MDDAFLLRMLDRDMQSKGIMQYKLFDEVIVNESHIPVGANEAVYIGYVGITNYGLHNFSVELVSATARIQYTTQNLKFTSHFEQHGSIRMEFESNHVTSHFSNVHITRFGERLNRILIRYVRVVFQSPNCG